MKLRAIFIEAVKRHGSFPITDTDDITVEESCFDHSYLEHLDVQIALSPRGNMWARRLGHRRERLAPYCDKPLIDGHIRHEACAYWLKVDPISEKVVYFEAY